MSIVFYEIKIMLEELENKKKITKNKIIVGKLSNEIIDFLNKNNTPIYTKEIYLTSKGLSHLARDSKKRRGAGLKREDILRIGEILGNISAVFFEKTKQKFNLLYCDNNSKRCIKIVVDTKGYTNRKEKITLIKTAGYINFDDMKNPDFELIFGVWNKEQGRTVTSP